ncbi:MAG TPA: glycosyltransferase family 87 protein [Acidobacteriaceae bacterium]|jgi:hypothetical protein
MTPATQTEASAPNPARTLLKRLAPVLIAILVAAPLFHIHVIRRDFPPAQPDLIPVWIGTRVALAHGNPYSDATTQQIQTAYYGRALRPSDNVNKMAYAYPAHTLVLFSPFARLSWPTTRLIFLLLLPILTAASVPMWLRVARIHLSPPHLALTILLTLASWTAVWGIHQIQPTLVVAALLAAGCWLLQRGNPAAAGILFALATIKPQLAGPLIAWLCLWTLLRRQWTFLLSFALTTAALLACATWLVPGWLPQWRAAMADYVVYRHLRPDLQFLFGHWLGLALEVVLAIAAAVALWTRRQCPPDSRLFGVLCATALATTVCLMPNETLMIYNHILLLPACLIVVLHRPAGRLAAQARVLALAQLALDYLVVPIAVLCDLTVPKIQFFTIVPFLDFLLPFLLALTLVLDILLPAPSPVAQPQWAIETAHS